MPTRRKTVAATFGYVDVFSSLNLWTCVVMVYLPAVEKQTVGQYSSARVLEGRLRSKTTVTCVDWHNVVQNDLLAEAPVSGIDKQTYRFTWICGWLKLYRKGKRPSGKSLFVAVVSLLVNLTDTVYESRSQWTYFVVAVVANWRAAAARRLLICYARVSSFILNQLIGSSSAAGECSTVNVRWIGLCKPHLTNRHSCRLMVFLSQSDSKWIEEPFNLNNVS